MNEAKRLWIAGFCAFLFFRIRVTAFSDVSNQFYFHWQWTDGVAILGLVAMSGLFLRVGHFVGSATGRWGRFAADLFFVAFATFYLKVAFLEVWYPDGIIPASASILTKYLVVLLVGVACFYRLKVVRWVSATCLILSPILVIFAGRLLMAESPRPSDRMQADSGVEAVRSGYADRVVWICLDGCSYERMFPDGSTSAPIPASINRLASVSHVFHRAYSPADKTFFSIPQILAGMNGTVVMNGNSGLSIGTSDGSVPFAVAPTVFRVMKQRGFQTRWYGYYLPAELFAGPDADVVHSVCAFKPLGRSLTSVGTQLLLQTMATRLGRFIPAFHQFNVRVQAQHAAAYDGWIQRMAVETAQRAENEFVFLHYRTPHEPFIHDRNGWFADPAVFREPSVEAYEGAMAQVDRALDQVFDQLDLEAKGQRTMLVVFADHTFREDPDLPLRPDPMRNRRVPFFIHLPGQTNRVDISRPVELTDLVSWSRQFMDTGECVWTNTKDDNHEEQR